MSSSTLPDGVLSDLAEISADELADIVSQRVWESTLAPAERERLSSLLPFADNEHERARALEAVFSMAPIRFGAPVGRVCQLLHEGQLSAAATAERERLQLAHAELVAQHHDDLVRQLHARRRTWVAAQPKPPKQEKRSKPKSDEWLVYSKESGGLVRRNQQRHVPASAPSAPVPLVPPANPPSRLSVRGELVPGTSRVLGAPQLAHTVAVYSMDAPFGSPPFALGGASSASSVTPRPLQSRSPSAAGAGVSFALHSSYSALGSMGSAGEAEGGDEDETLSRLGARSHAPTHTHRTPPQNDEVGMLFLV